MVASMTGWSSENRPKLFNSITTVFLIPMLWIRTPGLKEFHAYPYYYYTSHWSNLIQWIQYKVHSGLLTIYQHLNVKWMQLANILLKPQISNASKFVNFCTKLLLSFLFSSCEVYAARKKLSLEPQIYHKLKSDTF